MQVRESLMENSLNITCPHAECKQIPKIETLRAAQGPKNPNAGRFQYRTLRIE